MRNYVIKLSIWVMFFCGMSIQVSAQKGAIRKAEKEFENLAYIDAISIYEKIAEKGYLNEEMLKKLGDSYYFNGKLIEANKWYNELFNGDYEKKDVQALPSEYFYRFAQTLKAVEDYDQAAVIMEKFAVKERSDTRSKLYEEQKERYLKEIELNSNRYQLQNLSVNSAFSDYGATLLGDQLIFTSARETDSKSKRNIHEWTNESFTSLFSSTIEEDGVFGAPVKFAPELESKVNESSAVFTSDGKTMYFTRNNITSKGKGQKKKESYTLLKIYKAELSEQGKWTNVKELPFNSDDFNTAHPALTPDEKWLYFSSDRAGTIGQSDIYRVAIYPTGGYGVVENLSSKVNTEGRETFPFISKDNYLFFASDGHPGLGGLDIFVTKINVDGSFGKITNMGAPINSSTDDFGIYIDNATKKGFLSSNRAGGIGGDDIYFFTERSCQQALEGVIRDKDTKEILANTTITVYDNMFKKIVELQSDAQGYYKIEQLDCELKYRLKVESKDYITEELVVQLDFTPNGVFKKDIDLEKREKPIEVDDDLFKKLKLEPIYFDFDKSNIRPDAAIELMKIVEVLKQYPTMKIDIRSHTDSRGNDSYNLKLSNSRAEATIQWIVQQGIDANRVSGKGYGETRLLNHCANKVPCSTQEHQLNRRSEFIVLKL